MKISRKRARRSETTRLCERGREATGETNIYKQKPVSCAIDADLQLACEDVIALLAHPAIAPLQSFLSSTSSIPRPPPSAASDASRACIDAISRDLRSGAARLRLYVPDNRTVEVLLGHVRDRIVEEYGAFVGVVGREEGVVGVEDVREGVRGACSEDEEGGAGGSGST
ncbi:hypothetical protein PENSPDRAFT_63482 [Peniophora sp. CONT]|nr:hypothetical protein PENSPDRAFT_63482 [Peniophora sp. CONT]